MKIFYRKGLTGFVSKSSNDRCLLDQVATGILLRHPISYVCLIVDPTSVSPKKINNCRKSWLLLQLRPLILVFVLLFSVWGIICCKADGGTFDACIVVVCEAGAESDSNAGLCKAEK